MAKIQLLFFFLISITIIASCKNEKKAPITQDMFFGEWFVPNKEGDKLSKGCKTCNSIVFIKKAHDDFENFGTKNFPGGQEEDFEWKVKNNLFEFTRMTVIVKDNAPNLDTMPYNKRYFRIGTYKVDYHNPNEIDLLDTLFNNKISLIRSINND